MTQQQNKVLLTYMYIQSWEFSLYKCTAGLTLFPVVVVRAVLAALMPVQTAFHRLLPPPEPPVTLWEKSRYTRTLYNTYMYLPYMTYTCTKCTVQFTNIVYFNPQKDRRKSNTIQYITTQHNTRQLNTTQYNSTQHNTQTQHSTLYPLYVYVHMALINKTAQCTLQSQIAPVCGIVSLYM